MWKRLVNRIGHLSVLGRTGILAGSFIALAIAVGASSGHTSNSIVKLEQPASSQAQLETKAVVETRIIPFTTSTIQDATLDQGQSVTKIQGLNGVETVTYSIKYTNGKETSRTIVSDEVTTQPVNEVVAQGTKAPMPNCPNGTYVNTAGNTVCSPYDNPSTPASATAQCVDGTYSFSQSRSGTCSHHGGVAQWL